jgi:hypothetical protein
MPALKNILIILIMAGAFTCSRPETLPEIPEISFKSFTLDERVNELGNTILTGILVFRFQDGDGDIGFKAPDSIPEGDTTFYNLFFTLHEKKNGEYTRISNEDLPSPLYYRIPYMYPEGQNKTLSGDIDVEFEYLTIEYDTIFYDFFIIDRAGHRSNTDSTDDISFTEWKEKL